MKSLAEILNEENAANGQARPFGNPAAPAPGATGAIKVFAAAKANLKTGSLPSRLKFLNFGENKTTQGNYRVGPKTAATLAAKQKESGYERVAIDYDHCTVAGSAAHDELIKAGHPPLIFGYGRPNVIPGDGVYLEDVTWTPAGVQHAKNFEDLSAALADENNEVTFIHSVALCANGCTFDLPTFHSQLTALSASNPTTAGQRRMVNLAEIFNRENRATVTALSASGDVDAVQVDKAALPDTITVFPWGSAPEPINYLTVGSVTVDMLPKAQSAMGVIRVPIIEPGEPLTDEGGDLLKNLDHTAQYSEGQIIGTGRAVVDKIKGITLQDIQWTDAAREALPEYPGLCPAIWIDAEKNIIGLKSVTLCGGANTFTPLTLPRLINLSATAATNGYNRLGAAFDADNQRASKLLNTTCDALTSACRQYDAMMRRSTR